MPCVTLPTSNNLDKMKEEILTNNTIVTSWHNICLNIDVAQQAKNSITFKRYTNFLFGFQRKRSRIESNLKRQEKKDSKV